MLHDDGQRVERRDRRQPSLQHPEQELPEGGGRRVLEHDVGRQGDARALGEGVAELDAHQRVETELPQRTLRRHGRGAPERQDARCLGAHHLGDGVGALRLGERCERAKPVALRRDRGVVDFAARGASRARPASGDEVAPPGTSSSHFAMSIGQTAICVAPRARTCSRPSMPWLAVMPRSPRFSSRPPGRAFVVARPTSVKTPQSMLVAGSPRARR